MLKSVTLAVLFGAWGFLAGLLLPGFWAYSVAFLRKRGRTLKTVLSLCGRLLLALLAFGFLQVLVDRMTGELGAMTEQGPTLPFIVGSNIGFWGAIVALVIGHRRAQRRPPVPSR